MEMTDCFGENLLELFDTLDIELGNLNHNVIKAWFDTDCEDTKYFLKWLCLSLSSKNLISAEENAEVSQIDTFLTGDRYENSVNSTDSNFPGIFEDPDSVRYELEFLEDEKDLCEEELVHLEKIISIHEQVYESSCNEILKLSNEEISAKLRLEEAENKCLKLSKQLDEVNTKFFNQIKSYGSCLYNFEFASTPQFINNMRICDMEENYEMLSSYLNSFLKREYQDLSADITIKSISSDDYATDTLNEKIWDIRNRIFYSWQNCLAQKFEEEQLKAVLNFLNNYNINYSLLMIDRAQLEMNIEAKLEQKSVLLNMIENVSSKYADYEVSQPNLRFVQKELEVQQLKLDVLKELTVDMLKLFSSYMMVNTIFLRENNDIKSSDEFLKEVVTYITNDLQKCILRTEAMSDSINEFRLFSTLPLIQKSKLFNELTRHMTDRRDITLLEALSIRNNLMGEVSLTEHQVFKKDCDNHKNNSKQIREAVDALNDFLACGPTSRVMVVPSELLEVFKEIDMSMESQSASIKSTVQISSDTLSMLSKNKWLKNRRLIWMHFINDHPKLFSVLKSLEDEYNLKVTM